MAEITAALVKDLREKTGVGMMDCKKALSETNGDLEAAVDWLRAKGLSKAAKKADRAAAEGIVAIAIAADHGTVIELNSETDFVARNADFQKAAGDFAKLALKAADHDALLNSVHEGQKVSEAVTQLIATIGENITLRRSAKLQVENGVIAAYVHAKVDGQDHLGRIAVLVALESTGKKDELESFGKKLAMHIASANPLALSEADIPADRIEREKAVLLEQLKEDPKAAGKPQQVLDKMIEGRMRKFFEESVLTKQAFILNPDQTVEAAVADAAKAAGAPVAIKAFVRFGVGEGVEKKADDFAAEVAAMSGQKN
ncbi:translation elongation factor Ts [Vitreimonas flagellata]|uniref:translation elongation factor Ts n=1 Tax=Vitreimonas flagellata TaxID=2560861 RepID=UPI0010755C07|nr:translation elongation factor Ts [Vitreimonas flagellata]